MMSRTTSRVLWVIAGVLLVMAGIVCLSDDSWRCDAVLWHRGYCDLRHCS